jgi:hypothetical protein
MGWAPVAESNGQHPAGAVRAATRSVPSVVRAVPACETAQDAPGLPDALVAVQGDERQRGRTASVSLGRFGG